MKILAWTKDQAEKAWSSSLAFLKRPVTIFRDFESERIESILASLGIATGSALLGAFSPMLSAGVCTVGLMPEGTDPYLAVFLGTALFLALLWLAMNAAEIIIVLNFLSGLRWLESVLTKYRELEHANTH